METAQFIFKDTETGEEFLFPVTPEGYEIEHGRKAESLEMQTVGQVNLPGLPILFSQTLRCLLPARAYPFLAPGAETNPFVYLERLEKWSDAGTVLRLVVSGTPVNVPVLLESVTWREQDGTGDLYSDLTLRRFRPLQTARTDQATGNQERPAEEGPGRPNTYTVRQGDTLWAICRQFYGDPTVYPKVAQASGIANPSLIFPGQVLTLPGL